MAPGLIAARGDFIAGRWIVGEDGALERFSPRDFNQLVARHFTRLDAVDEAVAAARAAFAGWSCTSLDTRKTLLLELKRVMSARAQELALAIVHEVGKPR
ncbi:MAG TPA: aldehyde dehydrogenase family protein, partial [Polyangiales bacterium]